MEFEYSVTHSWTNILFMICKNEFEFYVTYSRKTLPRLLQQFHTR